MSDKKILLVGESNPYGPAPEYALYPAPEGCSGHRLCCVIFGMRRTDYIRIFARTNLCDGGWSIAAARKRVEELRQDSWRFVLLGAKVSQAFRVPFVPFEISESGTMLVMPHPSGRNRMWNDAINFTRAREALSAFAPEISPFLGALGAQNLHQRGFDVEELREFLSGPARQGEDLETI